MLYVLNHTMKWNTFLFGFGVTQFICIGATQNIFNYTLSAIFLKSISVLDSKNPNFNFKMHYKRRFRLMEHIKESKPTTLKLFPIKTNLKPLLTTLSADKCLIVINNFQGSGIHPLNYIPIILRQFEPTVLRIEHGKLINKGKYTQVIWTTRKHVHSLNGSFTKSIYGYETHQDVKHDCPMSKFYNPVSVKQFTSGFFASNLIWTRSPQCQGHGTVKFK